MKTILSIDGGGMKGYIPCSVLMEIERRAKRPCYEIFDIVAGTSIGGILASVISTGQSATEVIKFFTEDGPKIFGRVQPFGWGGVLRPRYAAEPLESALKVRLGSATLKDCKVPLLVTAFDLNAYTPVFFKSTKPNPNYALWEIGRATSAAQTYFPGFKLDDMILWDGGNAANNPTLCVVAEAFKLWGEHEKFRVLSVGCGAAKSAVAPDKLISPGIVVVGAETLGLLLDANDELPNYIMKQMLFDTDGYFRIQPETTRKLTLDGSDSKALKDLKDEAELCVHAFSDVIDQFINFK